MNLFFCLAPWAVGRQWSKTAGTSRVSEGRSESCLRVRLPKKSLLVTNFSSIFRVARDYEAAKYSGRRWKKYETT